MFSSISVSHQIPRVVEAALERAWDLLVRRQLALERLAQRLCEEETAQGEEVAAILAEAGAQPSASPETLVPGPATALVMAE